MNVSLCHRERIVSVRCVSANNAKWLFISIWLCFKWWCAYIVHNKQSMLMLFPENHAVFSSVGTSFKSKNDRRIHFDAYCHLGLSRSLSQSDSQCGACVLCHLLVLTWYDYCTEIQTTTSALKWNIHFHTYEMCGTGGVNRFHDTLLCIQTHDTVWNACALRDKNHFDNGFFSSRCHTTQLKVQESIRPQSQWHYSVVFQECRILPAHVRIAHDSQEAPVIRLLFE